MPEGPSIFILREQTQQFVGKKITQVSGNTKEPIDELKGKKVIAIKSFGKQFLICCKDVTVRIHLLMFGSYRINEVKDAQPRLSLQFGKKSLNFYTCSVKLLHQDLDELYDWSGDVMSDSWDERKALANLKKLPDAMVCDALLDQNIFAGVGNIIKNEVLFRVRVHPMSLLGAIPLKKKRELIKEARNYSFQFLEWKKEFTLREHWLAHAKKICPRDQVPFSFGHPGKTKRRAFYCELCQRLYE